MNKDKRPGCTTDKILWHKMKGHTDLNTQKANGEHVETNTDQGRHKTGDTRGREGRPETTGELEFSK